VTKEFKCKKVILELQVPNGTDGKRRSYWCNPEENWRPKESKGIQGEKGDTGAQVPMEQNGNDGSHWRDWCQPELMVPDKKRGKKKKKNPPPPREEEILVLQVPTEQTETTEQTVLLEPRAHRVFRESKAETGDQGIQGWQKVILCCR